MASSLTYIFTFGCALHRWESAMGALVEPSPVDFGSITTDPQQKQLGHLEEQLHQVNVKELLLQEIVNQDMTLADKMSEHAPTQQGAIPPSPSMLLANMATRESGANGRNASCNDSNETNGTNGTNATNHTAVPCEVQPQQQHLHMPMHQHVHEQHIPYGVGEPLAGIAAAAFHMGVSFGMAQAEQFHHHHEEEHVHYHHDEEYHQHHYEHEVPHYYDHHDEMPHYDEHHHDEVYYPHHEHDTVFDSMHGPVMEGGDVHGMTPAMMPLQVPVVHHHHAGVAPEPEFSSVSTAERSVLKTASENPTVAKELLTVEWAQQVARSADNLAAEAAKRAAIATTSERGPLALNAGTSKSSVIANPSSVVAAKSLDIADMMTALTASLGAKVTPPPSA